MKAYLAGRLRRPTGSIAFDVGLAAALALVGAFDALPSVPKRSVVPARCERRR
jgi:hypothetical protein